MPHAPMTLDSEFELLLLRMACSMHHRLSFAALSFARFTQLLSEEDRRRRDRRIPWISLVDPYESAFFCLYHSGNDQSLITITGFDHRTFSYLLNKFAPLYQRYSAYSSNGSGLIREVRNNGSRGSRPRTLDPCSCLGLVLCFSRTKGPLQVLQMVFGLSYSVLCLFLKFAIRLLLKVLLQEDASVREMMEVIEEKFHALDGVWCIMDGLKVPIQWPGDYWVQNAYYNGWLHGHFVGCVFVFAPDGTVVAASVNNPGSWHDSFIAENSGIYDKLEQVFTLAGGKCVVDAAFSLRRCPFLIKSGKEPLPHLENDVIVRDAQATSLR